MKAKLVGRKMVQFVGEGGRQIQGETIYVLFPEESTEGLCCEHFFLREEIGLPEGVTVNSNINIDFTHKGKIVAISKA